MINITFNYSKLRGRIVEKFGTQGKFAEKMGWSERTLSLKMNGEVPWKQIDIIQAIELLELEQKDISAYFFTYDVQDIEQMAGEQI